MADQINKAAADKAAADKAAADKAVADKAVADKAVADKAELEKAELEKAELEKAELEKAELEKAELEKADKAIQGNFIMTVGHLSWGARNRNHFFADKKPLINKKTMGAYSKVLHIWLKEGWIKKGSYK